MGIWESACIRGRCEHNVAAITTKSLKTYPIHPATTSKWTKLDTTLTDSGCHAQHQLASTKQIAETTSWMPHNSKLLGQEIQ